MAARSPGPAAAASAPAAPAPLIRAVCEELTGTRTSTLRKARLHTRERNWAKGTATSARGRERATQERKFPSPIPGSMTTGTAPILNSANTEATSGRPGRTITRGRSPRRTPLSASRERQPSPRVAQRPSGPDGGRCWRSRFERRRLGEKGSLPGQENVTQHAGGSRDLRKLGPVGDQGGIDRDSRGDLVPVLLDPVEKIDLRPGQGRVVGVAARTPGKRARVPLQSLADRRGERADESRMPLAQVHRLQDGFLGVALVGRRRQPDQELV